MHYYRRRSYHYQLMIIVI